jgi:hypothetical protein
MKRIVLIVIVFVVLVGVVGWLFAFRKSSLSVKSEKPAYELTSDMLLAKFVDDENSANAQYLNKVILVSGKVGKVEDTKEGINVYLVEPGESSGIICTFDPSVEKKENFKLGQVVTVKGLCTGYLFDVVMVKCVLAKGST